MSSKHEEQNTCEKSRLSAIAKYFFQLGLTGFGGPLAIIGRMQTEIVQQKKWMNNTEFQSAITLIKSLPGPLSTMMAIHVGRHRGGLLGGIFAGLCFIIPSFFMMIGLSHYYEQFRSMEMVANVMRGLQAAAYILILLSLYDLTKPYHSRSKFWAWTIMSLFLLLILHLSEPVVILGIGALAAISETVARKKLVSIPIDLLILGITAGGLSFGTGLSIVPLLQGSIVQKYNWLTQEQFLDALAMGQMTPGPVLITLTFIGYKMAGWSGALIATFAVFFPAFVNMLTWFPRMMKWLHHQKWLMHFVLGATAALAAGIFTVLFSMGHDFTFFEFFLPFTIVLITKRKIPTWALLILTAFIFGVVGHFVV